jgi:hypothetical protein
MRRGRQRPGEGGRRTRRRRQLLRHGPPCRFRRATRGIAPPHSSRPVRAAREAMKTGAPGRAPGRPALPSSQTGRRLAVRPACSPSDVPARGRPVGAEGAFRSCAWMADGRFADGAGGRRWGRPAAQCAPETARLPPPTHVRDRALPRPASRTPVPFPRHRAPARGASACSVGGSSARGTCVRKPRGGVGRNGAAGPACARPIWLCAAEKRTFRCNASCKRPRAGTSPPAQPVHIRPPGRARVARSTPVPEVKP